MAAKYPTLTVYRAPLTNQLTAGPFTINVHDGSHEWRWRIRTRNGQIVGTSHEAYDRRWHCLNGAAAALGLPKSITSLKLGEEKVVRRSGGPVLVRVEASP